MWTEDEINDAIGPERARVFKPHYFVKPSGNAVLSPRSDPHREFGGLNTLIERQSLQDTAKQLGDATDPILQSLLPCLELFCADLRQSVPNSCPANLCLNRHYDAVLRSCQTAFRDEQPLHVLRPGSYFALRRHGHG